MRSASGGNDEGIQESQESKANPHSERDFGGPQEASAEGAAASASSLEHSLAQVKKQQSRFQRGGKHGGGVPKETELVATGKQRWNARLPNSLPEKWPEILAILSTRLAIAAQISLNSSFYCAIVALKHSL